MMFFVACPTKLYAKSGAANLAQAFGCTQAMRGAGGKVPLPAIKRNRPTRKG